MKCDPYISLPGQEADCSPTSSSDTSPSEPSNSTPTVAPSCEPDATTAGSRGCVCTSGTSACSIHPSTPDEWILFMRVSLASMLALQEQERGLTGRDPDLCSRPSALSMLSNLDLFYSKTALQYKQEGEIELLPSLWRKDIPGVTEYCPLLLSEQITEGVDGGCLLPTPTVCGNYNKKGASKHSGDGLITALRRKYPTPCASDWKGSTKKGQRRGQLSEVFLGGKLNPRFVEWMMGFPIGFTKLRR